MYFSVLGELAVSDGERLCTPHRAKLRDLLALLLVDAGREVSRKRLVADLWDHNPPATAESALYSYVSQLRRTLCPDSPRDTPDRLLRTASDGYRIAVDTDECDLLTFDRLVGQGTAAMDSGDAALAVTVLRDALSLWRGPAFSDITLPVVRNVYAPQLEERRLAVVGRRIEADLLLGRHDEVIPELEQLTTENPLNERFVAQLLRALAAAGRCAEALEIYQELSTRLREELGLDPDAELQALRETLTNEASLVGHTHAGQTGQTQWRIQEQLPRDLPDFTGRHEAIQIREALCRSAMEGARLPCLITGPAGSGKTAFAVRLAHSLKDRFPDGQLFTDLRGFECQPLDPAKVIGDFLADLGMDRDSIPAEERQRAELFRAQLADRRVLLLLDNADSEAQLRPLLTVGPHCAVLMTSRSAFSRWNGVSRISIGALNTSESVHLLASIVGGRRVDEENSAAQRIVHACHRLPLAIRIAGNRLSVREHWSLEEFANQLDDDRTLLDELIAGDLEVRASMARTYFRCTELERRMLRFLSVAGSRDFPAWLAAALAGIDVSSAQHVMASLVQVQLLRESWQDVIAQSRYRFQPLVQIFARERFDCEETPDARRAATERGVAAIHAAGKPITNSGMTTNNTNQACGAGASIQG